MKALTVADFREAPALGSDGAAPDARPVPVVTSEINRVCPSLWQCDFCGQLRNGEKPVPPSGWSLVFARRDPWWGDVHLVTCGCTGQHRQDRR